MPTNLLVADNWYIIGGFLELQAIGIVLLILSVGLIVAPVGVMACVHRNDLSGLVYPNQVRGLLHGDTSFILNQNSRNNPNSILYNLVAPNFVDATVNETSKAFVVKINVTNPLTFALTLKTFSTQVQTPNGQEMASITIHKPVTLCPDRSTIIQVDGAWTQTGECYLYAHKADSSITICIANIVVDVNGLKVERDTPLPITIPISFAEVAFTD